MRGTESERGSLAEVSSLEATGDSSYAASQGDLEGQLILAAGSLL
jgi:hypothetical protein